MEVDTPQYELSDLVRYSYEGQPAKVQDVFNELMMGRMYDAIQQKKVEVAQNFFGQHEAEVESEEGYDDEEGNEDGQSA
jgi:hypothetical protein